MTDYKQVDIYLYDPITKEFIKKDVSDRNPLDPETPIIPSCATTEVVPEEKEGYIRCWIGNKWTYKEDHRGETWYNASTKTLEVIDFIGELPNYYYTPDSTIANPPEGSYWVYDQKSDTWVGNALLYKQYILENYDVLWELKLNAPFEFEGYRYIASWRELYTSIWVSLKDGLKQEYRLQDYDGKQNVVTAETMKPIIIKISDIVDELYTDKHNLEKYFAVTNDFKELETAFNAWLNKEYK